VRRWEKLLFLLLPAPQHLAFNARLDCYQVSITRLFWMFRSEPLVFDEQLMALAAMENYILLLQTADDRGMLKAIGALRDPRIADPAPIAVFCRQDKRAVFQGVPGVKAVYTYQPGKRWEGLRALLRLRKLRVDVLAAVLTGEPFARLYKLLFVVLPARHRLVFNPDFNCFYLNRLNPLSVVPFFRVAHKPKRCILLIQTADDTATLRALAKARDPRVTKPAPFVVFCREDNKGLFADVPGVDDVITYEPKRRLRALRTLLRLFKMDIEVVAALFTGEPIFHLQKLLFFILPTRNRLVFNHNLDCYYLNRSTFWSLFRSEERLGQLSSSLLVARLLGKGLLFLPRFFYLVIWVTGQKLKRAYILAAEVR
jgi:ADP-heptose:LPS heptosyltransferase